MKRNLNKDLKFFILLLLIALLMLYWAFKLSAAEIKIITIDNKTWRLVKELTETIYIVQDLDSGSYYIASDWNIGPNETTELPDYTEEEGQNDHSWPFVR